MQLAERLLVPGSEESDELIGNILRRRDQLSDSEPADAGISTALVIGGGAMRGVFSGGVVTGLEELGLTAAFDNVVGVSVGASTNAYFLAGQARLGTSLFFDELTTKEFVDITRRGNILSVDYLNTIFTTGKKVLDLEAVRNNRSRFHIGITALDTAQPVYAEVSDAEDEVIIKHIQASSAVPGLARPVIIDGVKYGDGITACKNPVRFAVEELGATDVLCILNQPLRYGHASSIGDRALSAFLSRGYGPLARDAFRSRHEGSDEMAETTYNPNIRIGIACPADKPIGRLTRDKKKLIRVAQEAEEYTLALFENNS